MVEASGGGAGRPGGASPALIDRFYQWRNRLIGARGFQRWAARFPLTRPIANARARELFDLTAGFVYSQILEACVRLDVFEMLADGPLSARQIAHRAGLAPDAAERLLDAAAALDLLTRRGDAYRLGQLGAALLGNPGVIAMIRHHHMLYRDLGDPVALLKGEISPEIKRFWAYSKDPEAAGLSTDEVAAYSRLMAVSQQFIAEDVLDARPLTGVGRLLDLGGGEGAFLAEVARRHPALELRLFDLPGVAARATARFESEGIAGRARADGGDFFADPLPEGCDAVSLVRVIYDHDDAFALRLLRRAREALPAGGRLILAEPMANAAGAERVGAYFAFYLLAMGSGRARSAADLSDLIAEAGFRRIRVRRTARPMLTGLITAEA